MTEHRAFQNFHGSLDDRSKFPCSERKAVAYRTIIDSLVPSRILCYLTDYTFRPENVSPAMPLDWTFYLNSFLWTVYINSMLAAWVY